MKTFFNAARGVFRLPSIFCLGILALANSGISAALGNDSRWKETAQNTNFLDSVNWSDGVPGTNANTNNTDTAFFTNSNQTELSFGNSGSRYIGSFDFSNSTASSTLASAFTFGALTSSFELRLTTGGSNSIRINPRVEAAQTFNALIALKPGSYTFSNYGGTGATLNFNNTIRSTTTAGGASTLILTGSNTSANNIKGAIVNGTATTPMSLSKTDVGTWVLSGANTYTGTTTVTGGTLLVNNTSGSGTGSGAVTVNGTGTLLGGVGTISGAVSVAGGGTINAGNPGVAGNAAAVGTLRTGALTLESNSFTLADIASATSYDQIVSSGALTLGGTFSASVATGQNFNMGDTLRLLSGTGLTGTFDNIANGQVYTFSGYAFTAKYTPTEFDLVAVPEPGTVAAGILALGALGWGQRRRLRKVVSTAQHESPAVLLA